MNKPATIFRIASSFQTSALGSMDLNCAFRSYRLPSVCCTASETMATVTVIE